MGGGMKRRDILKLGAMAATEMGIGGIAGPVRKGATAAPLLPSLEQAKPRIASHPCPIKADLWVLAGQSNMQAWGTLNEPLKLDPKRIVNFRMNNEWSPPFEPIHWNVEAADTVHRDLLFKLGMSPEEYKKERAAPRPIVPGGVDVGGGFAKQIVDNSAHNIGLIPCAMGGIPIKYWDPALKDKGSASLYGSMYDRIQMVGGRIKGILWYQGESDAYEECVGEYRKRFLELIDAIRRDTGDPDLPFLYVQISRYYDQDRTNAKWWEAIRDIQRHVTSERKKLYMVSAVDADFQDRIHISGESTQLVGQRLAEVALSEVYDQPDHGHSITLESVNVIGRDTATPAIRLTFGGVTGRLRAAGRPADFELRSDGPPDSAPVIYRTDFDPHNPAGLVLRVNFPFRESTRLIYGSGMTPFMNLVDDKNMSVPAFGPIDLPDN